MPSSGDLFYFIPFSSQGIMNAALLQSMSSCVSTMLVLLSPPSTPTPNWSVGTKGCGNVAFPYYILGAQNTVSGLLQAPKRLITG